MTKLIDVGATQEFEEGAPRIMTLDGREVGVVRWNSEFFALRNLCPHQTAPLCLGRLLPPINSGGAVGTIEVGGDTPVIACPWHGWEFDIRTGESVWDPAYRVRSYQTTVRDGRVLVEMGRS